MKKIFNNKKFKSIFKNKHIIVMMIIIATLFLGVGYAQISDIDLSVSGSASANKQEGVVISEITYLSNNNADVAHCKINTYYQTTMDSKIVLGTNSDSSITYQVSITNLTNETREFKGATFDESFYDNPEIDFEINGLNIGDSLAAGETKTFTVTFKYKEPKASYDSNVLNSYLNFIFGKSIIDEFSPTGVCEFHGKNNDVIGDCAGGEHVDHINTGIALFSAANRDKDFEIGFTVDSIDPSRFRSGKVDTIFDCLNDATPYPGIAFRIENSKWYLQVGKGSNNKKLTWNPSEIQSFVLKKINYNVYYSINGGEDVFVENLETIPVFNGPLTFGTALAPNGGAPRDERFLIANLSNIYVRVTEPENPEPPRTYEVVDQEIATFLGETMTTVYSSPDQHTFDKTAANIIDTGVELFNSTNYEKSFVVTLKIDEFSTSGQVNQATLFNAKDESNNTYPGLMMRLSNGKYEISMKDGTGKTAQIFLPIGTERVNLIKKGMTMYYQYDLGEILPLSNTNDFSGYPIGNTFTIPATFGCNINGTGNYDRMMAGKLSDLKIQIGS